MKTVARILVFVFLLTPVPVFAQAAAKADLRLTKTLTRPPTGGQPAQFSIVVTNLGPQTYPGPIVVSDTISAGTVSAAPGQPQWTCSPSSGLTIVCTRTGALSPGNSVVLLVDAQSKAGDRQNCATVRFHAGDPSDVNNRDCTCVEFQPCRDVTIDVTTGRHNGAAQAVGSTDGDWSVTVPPGATEQSGLAQVPTRTNPWFNPGSSNAAWISAKPNPPTNSPAMTPGNYTYSFGFATGPEWTGRKCTLRFQYAADNTVSFQMNGASVTSLNNGSAFNVLQPAFTYTFTPLAGANTFTAVVRNNPTSAGTGTRTALLVIGTINCKCPDTPIEVGNPNTR